MNYNNEEIKQNALCCECGKIHIWDIEDCEIYDNKFLCKECFQDKYGYCNVCGELNKYSNMNDNIECKDCGGYGNL